MRKTKIRKSCLFLCNGGFIDRCARHCLSYLGMTVHCECEGELQPTTIGVREMKKQHTSKVIGRWMRTILEDWHITDEKIRHVKPWSSSPWLRPS